MATLPESVRRLTKALESLPGVREVDVGMRDLDGIDLRELSLPGEFGDLPHAAIRRTRGGLKDESLMTFEVRFKQNHAGWVALEFLAWWVRDLSRAGELVQMRALALPPVAFGTQLGRTLKCVIELFAVAPDGDRRPVLAKVGELADSLEGNLEDYAKAIAHPTRAEFEDVDALKRGAENDDASAQFDLAMCYANGDGVKQNPERAFDWFRRAARLGHPDAMLQLGLRYEGGDGVDQDYDRAFKWYLKAAEAGVPLGNCCVAGAYQEGKGVEKDLAKAVEWYRRGADLDDAPSQAELGECYELGKGVKKDLAEALRWYEAALGNGLTDAEPAIARVKKAMR
jgi:tetratricopeptide (TPR) repeat protein